MTQQYLKYEKSSSSEFQTRLENNNIIEIRTTSLFNEFLLFSQPNAEFIFWQIYVKTSEIWVLFLKKSTTTRYGRFSLIGRFQFLSQTYM